MNHREVQDLRVRINRLERANRHWRWTAILAPMAPILVLLLVVPPWPRTADAQVERVGRSTILKFGDVYVNTFYVTRVEYRSKAGDPAIMVYFAGGAQDPLRLSREDGEMMRPWLEGHSIDLSPESRKAAPTRKAPGAQEK